MASLLEPLTSELAYKGRIWIWHDLTGGSKVNPTQTTVDASVLLEGMESCKMKRTIERIPQACHLWKSTNGGACCGVMYPHYSCLEGHGLGGLKLQTQQSTHTHCAQLLQLLVPFLQLGFWRKSRLMHRYVHVQANTSQLANRHVVHATMHQK